MRNRHSGGEASACFFFFCFSSKKSYKLLRVRYSVCFCFYSFFDFEQVGGCYLYLFVHFS